MPYLPEPAAGGDDPDHLPPDSRRQFPAPESSKGPVPRPSDEAPAPPDPPWRLGDLFVFLVFAGFATLLLLVLAEIVFGALKTVLGWTIQPQAALGSIPALLSIQLALEGLCFLFIYLVVTRKYRQPFWRAIHWFPSKAIAPAAVVTGIVLAIALQWFTNLSPPSKPLPVEEWFSSAASAYAVAFIGVAVAPFVEELVFRGFFYPVFERRWGLPAAVLITSVLFALLHGSQLGWTWKEIAAIFFVGLVLTYVRGRTGSLVPSYLMHLAYNSTLFITLYVSTDRFHNLSS